MNRTSVKSSAKAGSGAGQGGRVEPVVLHIDDDANDRALLQAAAAKAKAGFLLRDIEDGEQALAYLRGSGAYKDRKRHPLPSLILLDLKMPRANGLEVLRWIRRRAEFATLPVVVLSGSELQEDMQQAGLAGASSYHVKPLGFDELVSLVRKVQQAWLGA